MFSEENLSDKYFYNKFFEDYFHLLEKDDIEIFKMIKILEPTFPRIPSRRQLNICKTHGLPPYLIGIPNNSYGLLDYIIPLMILKNKATNKIMNIQEDVDYEMFSDGYFVKILIENYIYLLNKHNSELFINIKILEPHFPRITIPNKYYPDIKITLNFPSSNISEFSDYIKQLVILKNKAIIIMEEDKDLEIPEAKIIEIPEAIIVKGLILDNIPIVDVYLFQDEEI